MKFFAAASAIIASFIFTSASVQSLEQGFRNPPMEARPMVWWHWMNGGITKDGIRKDLEWMDSVGISGVQLFDINIGSQAPVMEENATFMNPEWQDDFMYALGLAREKGMTFGIASSPGWSQSGGPWVKPEQAMKKLCWSETDVKGRGKVSIMIPAPPSGAGTFQNTTDQGSFYRDVAVIGMRLPAKCSLPKPEISSSGGKFSAEMLQDGDFYTSVELPYGNPGERIWILYEYPFSQVVTAADVALSEPSSIYEKKGFDGPPILEYSEDGVNFTKLADIPQSGVPLRSVSFKPVRAKFFRFSMVSPEYAARDPRTLIWRAPARKPTGVWIAEFRMRAMPRVNHFAQKAGFDASVLANIPTPEYSPTEVIRPCDVTDLTSLMAADGTLNWDAPDGDWRILRFGYSLTGRKNGPAAKEATGLEVDKMNEEYVRGYLSSYLGMFDEAAGGMKLNSMVTDSWEAGCQNWTDSMAEDFKSLRGYDLLPWMPALAGYVIGSSEDTDKFLYDFRKTIGDLIVRNYYEVISQMLAVRGMLRYSESHEGGRAFVGDGMEVKRSADVPMGAMWLPSQSQEGADIKESASVAHIYGQKYIAAESLSTSGNSWCCVPENLKPTADMEMASGLNRFVIHSSVHQPLEDHLPGVTLGAFGQWFNRHDTWAWNAAKPWIDYLSRSCFMLQQGSSVADILWFYGEGSNITACYPDRLPHIPEGYDFDFVNADAMLGAISVRNGKIVAKSGNEYSLLCIDPVFAGEISLPVLLKIEKLIGRGAMVVGRAPSGSPSLEDDVKEYAGVVSRLWGDGGSVRRIGKGCLFSSMDAALEYIGISPDVIVSGMDEKDFRFVHRRDGCQNWYWMLNRSGETQEAEVSLNVRGYMPELWNAEDGSIRRASYRFEGSRTVVPLHLEPLQAIFIVFRSRTGEMSWAAPDLTVRAVSEVAGGWQVSFDGFDAPSDTLFDALADWSLASSPMVRYYSGTAAYSKKIVVDGSMIGSGELWLDLGDVKNIAEVFFNGHKVGIGWKAPFRFNVSEYARAGENDLLVKVTNSWANRLIGDLQPGARKYAWTSRNLYVEESPLRRSGLLGPVILEVLH
ncbi:MAG: glycosyl hydrolase [Bacteroidales bacterium]|nr:glycosyl hydrolase [Bacteroidales bacterium]MDY6001550.1 glycosyl hydrolase [Candidatus Cryptobacteroides sp.]